ncbi:MAG: alpha-2-macroglobulin [Spirochaetaceae bacterium]|nr:alpha-2-macroglobulin [Spirochaetaceae bacterium]
MKLLHYILFFMFTFLSIFSLASCSKNDEVVASDSELQTDDGFYVIDMQPNGELPSSMKYPSVYVQFSKPVVAVEKLGVPSNTSEYMKIEPSLEGVYRWYGTSLLCFDSTEQTIPQREYKVSVSKNVKAIDGTALSGQTEFSFKTEELELVSITPGYSTIQKGGWVDNSDIPPEQARSIALYFSYPVQLSEITKYLEVVDANGITFDYDATQPVKEQKQIVILELKKAPEENTTVNVILRKGASSEPGFLPTSVENIHSFHTLTPLTLTDISESRYSSSQYPNPVDFKFSHRLNTEMDLAKVAVAVKTEPAMNVTKENIAVTGSVLKVFGLPVTFGQTYTISIAGGVISDENGRVYKENCGPQSITVPEAASYAGFKDYGLGMLEAQFPPKLAFEYQNILPGSWYSIRSLSHKNTEEHYQAQELTEELIPKNTRVIKTVDLEPFLEPTANGYRGAVEFEAQLDYTYIDYWETENVRTASNHQFVQVTDLGLTVRYGYNRALVLVTKLSTGEPVANADVSIYKKNVQNSYDFYEEILGNAYTYPFATGKTDENGLAIIHFSNLGIHTNDFYVAAEKDGDRALFNPTNNRLWGVGARTVSPISASDSQMVTFMFTDRGLYKPGETLQLRGIDRNLTLGQYEPYREKYKITLKENRWRAEDLMVQKGEASENGGFTATFKLPEDLTPGTYVLEYERNFSGLGNTSGKQQISFTVAYFERLRFESSVTVPELTYVSGDRVSADIYAAYLGGGSLAGASWYGNWYREPTGFSLSGSEFEGFRFGPRQGYDGRTALGTENGVLGESGTASASQLSGDEKVQGMAYRYRFESTVTDAGGQAISASGSTTVHPAQYYIGLSGVTNIKGFPKKGDKLDFDFILVEPDGASPSTGALPAKAADKKLSYELLREDWKQVRQIGLNGQLITRYVREMISEQSGTVTMAEKGSLSVTPPKGGAYILRLTGQDSQGRTAVTERSFYVSGSDWNYYYSGDSQAITLLADKDLYQVGDTAQIMLQSPLPKGTYLMTVEREGIFSQELIKLEEPTSVLEVPITDRYLPVVYVTVSSYSVRNGPPSHDFETKDMDKPKGYFGATALHVDIEPREIEIKVTQDKASYRPGEEATITLSATKAGQPLVGAELTLMAVDRGVIDLINYHVPNPLEYFYRDYLFPSGVLGGDSRSLLIDPVTYEVRNLYGGDEGGEKMDERKNFDPTAVFVPALITGPDGTVTHSFTLPDNLTEYRVTAVGMLDSYFGITEDELLVNNPVSVRDVMPRRLREGDVSDAGVVISSVDGEAHKVSVSVEVLSGVEAAGISAEDQGSIRKAGRAIVTGTNSKSIEVPAGKTVPLLFDITSQEHGWVTVIFTVKSDVVNERIIKTLQIDRPYIFEMVTTVGEVSSGSVEKKGSASASEKIVLPSGVKNDDGSNLFVSLDPTRLGTLTEAVDYVFRYPYGCLEQRCSSMIPLMYFSEYIDVFGLKSEVSNPNRLVEKEIKSWASTQKADGGFPYWRSSNYSSFAPTLRFAELIAVARDKGVKIPSSIDMDSLIAYLRAAYQDQVRYRSPFSSTYTLWVISKLTDVTEKQIDDVAAMEGAGFSEKAMCGLMYLKVGNKGKAASIAKEIRAHCRPTTRGVDITDPEFFSAPWMFLNDESEQNALLLQFFTELDYTEDMNGRLLHNLLALQQASNGYWRTTASTARVLEAVATYIKANNLESLDFSAEAKLAGKTLAEAKFKGAAAKPHDTNVPLSQLVSDGNKTGEPLDLEFSKDGVGTLFYTVSMKYPIPAEEQYARDEGISVFVDIVDVKTGEIVTNNQLTAGSIYKAKVTISTTRDRTFVATRIPIPSGAEVLNAAFATTEKYVDSTFEEESEPDYYDWDYFYGEFNYGLSAQEIYDNEVRYFWDYFRRGKQQVEFMFRAVRNGEFNVPSATAECMYEPEIFGRSKGGVFVISEKK